MTWVETFTGRRVYLLEPHPEQIVIEDVAHHLACTNRFIGATREPYSTAQHSVLACDYAPAEHKLQALLHDAPEAYLGDWARPLKYAVRMRTNTRATEASPIDGIYNGLAWAVGRTFGVELQELHPEVKEVDDRMLATEWRDLMSSKVPEHFAEPFSLPIDPWPWSKAKRLFLWRFRELTKGLR
jgi:uncharacterized protein